jgi:tetratricopeptide (TPR) repeat protein
MHHPPIRPLIAACLTALVLSTPARAADLDECRAMMLRGEYEECLKTTTQAIEDGVYGEAWRLLKAEAELILGRYDDALDTLQTAMERYAWSIRLRVLAIEACRYAGQPELVENLAEEVTRLAQATPWRYTDAENLVTLGRFLLDQGADAKEVQGAFFQRAKRNNPLSRTPVLALGNLALSKRDFQLAAEVFRPALEQHADDPEILFGLAQALMGSDPEAAQRFLIQALEKNPRLIDALLMQADRLIDGEQYDAARQKLRQVTGINEHHPEALALLSVLSLLQGEEEEADELHERALSTWRKNPLVDHVIGRKLSQKYRFQEGAARQRQALEFDPQFLPARKQLAQDLLRLGDEEEGWELAHEAFQADQYDVAMYNLVTLQEELERFETLEAEGLAVRMDRHEAAVYGNRVMNLLVEARQVLTEKYEVELPRTVLVEIFPRPSDFAVRTFGMPVAGGYLGVCFGNVVTANSPASQQSNPANWESVLWHEFAHVVTLNKTNNRMPRWLSEGISVYEERQRDPTWGERMTPTYREMILGDDLTPVGELSSAFLSPPSSMHLQFAYFQSSLVVEHIIDNHGFAALLSILDDLGVGMAINEALERHTVPLGQLEDEFEAYAVELARNFGADVDWTPVDLSDLAASPDAATQLKQWADENPTHYRGLKACARALLRMNETEAAREILEQMIDLFPHETGPSSPFVQLAELYRQAGEVEQERELLLRYAAMTDAAVGVFQRLIELETQREEWASVRRYALQLMAVNPLIVQPNSALARVAEVESDAREAVVALETLVLLDPHDPADLHYRLARQWRQLDAPDRAKRHVLQALEEAPRFRAALGLLLELQE